MTEDKIIEMAKEYFSSIEYDDGVVHEFYEFSLEELVDFVKVIATQTLMKIDPSSFMSYQEGFEAGQLAERERCAELIPPQYFEFRDRIRARGQK